MSPEQYKEVYDACVRADKDGVKVVTGLYGVKKTSVGWIPDPNLGCKACGLGCLIRGTDIPGSVAIDAARFMLGSTYNEVVSFVHGFDNGSLLDGNDPVWHDAGKRMAAELLAAGILNKE